MKTTKILAVLFLALGVMVCLSSVASGAQYLRVNGQDVNSITMKPGQACIVSVVSDDSNYYSAHLGFDNGIILGVFSLLEIVPVAGDLASATDYNVPGFHGYYVSANGSAPPPSPGIHFFFEYITHQIGETDLKIYDSTFTSVIDSVHITVIPTSMGTAFTCQGRLMDDNKPADGLYDFRFKLFDSPDPVSAMQLEMTIDINDLDIIDGQFAVELDFGSDVFDGDARWLETAVRPGDSNDPNAFVTLNPRQELTPVPYALHTRGIIVDNNGNVGIGTNDPNDKLDVNGNINTNTFYKIGGETVLANPDAYNLFVGVGAGENNTGSWNTFFGDDAGYFNNEGYSNTFIGYYAGYLNTAGYKNTFVGSTAGYVNTTGSSNTFLGDDSGHANTTGSSNTFVGSNAGCGNTTGSWNTFIGDYAGSFNTTGYENTFVGSGAGSSNKGTGNVFIGHAAGDLETGSNKLYIANGPSDSNTIIYGDFSTGNVGIGTTSAGAKLDVVTAGGDAVSAISYSGYGVFGETGSSPYAGVYGKSTYSASPGVFGENTDANTSGSLGGLYWGVKGYSPDGHGVWGKSPGGYGVYGETGSLQYAGVYGKSTISLGPGVYGENTDANTHGSLAVRDCGVFGYSPDGHGVEGKSTNGAGVYGETASVSHAGVHGKATEALNAGVFGENAATNTRGSLGGLDWGVKGYSTNGYGVYGGSTVNGWAGYFSGDVYISGNLTKGSGSFRIDHPLDPENKYLSHSFVESPDMMNVYNGNVVLDNNGEAEIKLPDYFEALNHDFRYQLTCIGGFAQVYIAEKISDNRFKIAGGKKEMEVSWQVTGIRQDRYAQAHRIAVEEDKPIEARGHYLYPELYGYGQDKSIEAARNTRISESRQVAKNENR